jgi:ABC-type multidrug transport system fused ATPase/permease subunit
LKNTFINIFSVLDSREKKRLIKLTLFDVIISVLDISFLAMLLYVVHFYTNAQPSISLTYFPFTIFNQYPLALIIVFFVLFCIKNMAGFFVFQLHYRFIYEVASRLSKNNLLNYMEGSYHDYIHTDSSMHTRRISQQPIEFCHYVLGGTQTIIAQAILIFTAVIAILFFNALLFPLLFIILAPPVILSGYLMKKKLNAIRKSAKLTSQKTMQYLQEALDGFIESNLYKSKDFFINRYHLKQVKFNRFLADQQVIQNMPSRLIEVFAIFGLLILVLINTYTIHSSTIQLITIGAFMAAAYKIIPGIVKILNSIGQIKAYEFTVHDLLQNKFSPPARIETNETITSIDFNNVSFSFREKKVMNNFSLSIKQGEFIGLTGLSGKGKTTIINLLLGFMNPDSGNILINKTCTTPAMRQQFWNKIAYIKQQPFFIHDSIYKNISLQETHDPQRINELMGITGLHHLHQRDDGMDTLIAENGKNISGGQRQRLIMARALYKEADLVILDEPFNELDWETEKQFLQHFSKLTASGKIVILISHHQKSLSLCSKIITLDEG